MTVAGQVGLASKIAASSSPLTPLLTDAVLVGGIYNLDYDSAIVVTNDIDKRRAGGIPKNCFLLAAGPQRPMEPIAMPLDEDEVILLRVRSVADLPNQLDLVAIRMEAMRDAYEKGEPPASEAISDRLTQKNMQYSAFRCDVLGTFYPDTVSGRPFVQWGADIDTVYSASRYFVYAPSPAALSYIASYPQRSADEVADNKRPDLIPLGDVRYSATRRRATEQGYDKCPVNVRVTDFISRKTAVFGMTRAGKSNTNKTIATAVFEHAAKTQQRIGQLIFDPQGEYASINQQDKTGLRLLGLGTDLVKIYTMSPNLNDPQEHPLAINFYNTRLLDMAWGSVVDALAEYNTGYANAFKTAKILDPDRDDFPSGQAGEKEYWEAVGDAQRGRLAFYGTLSKANFRSGVAHGFSVTFRMAKPLREMLLADVPDALTVTDARTGTCKTDTPDRARHIVKWIADRTKEEDEGTLDQARYKGIDLKSWRNCAPFTAIRTVFDESVGKVVINKIRQLADFHDPTATGDLADLVWSDLTAGRLVIVDLSVGSQDVSTAMSERLVFRLLDKANDRFRKNQQPIPIQIMVEEAHNLFDRQKAGKSTVRDDPWVRLAKEAAKYEIGLIYATQEVSSVDQRILSNTSNWIVAHLNSDVETRELSHYYDYAIFAQDIRSAEDRGYVRMKTFSGKYIVPTQIAKFDHAMINRARMAAGLPEVDDQGRLVTP
ncbi:ATP-binding protein [Amycolatopsis sp. CA-161197]|uniref:ATP-binding protein n=1 Tax=Amycolatopsis sp. CA-161197 TaxID=3239922 RepID=UPI003D9176BC